MGGSMYKVTNIAKQVLSVPVLKNGKPIFIRLEPGKSDLTERILNHGNLSVYLRYEKVKTEASRVIQRKSSLPKVEAQNIENAFKGEE